LRILGLLRERTGSCFFVCSRASPHLFLLAPANAVEGGGFLLLANRSARVSRRRPHHHRNATPSLRCDSLGVLGTGGLWHGKLLDIVRPLSSWLAGAQSVRALSFVRI